MLPIALAVVAAGIHRIPRILGTAVFARTKLRLTQMEGPLQRLGEIPLGLGGQPGEVDLAYAVTGFDVLEDIHHPLQLGLLDFGHTILSAQDVSRIALTGKPGSLGLSLRCEPSSTGSLGGNTLCFSRFTLTYLPIETCLQFRQIRRVADLPDGQAVQLA
ncbi:hypothetical protein D3C78_1038180 [compost metagenome]